MICVRVYFFFNNLKYGNSTFDEMFTLKTEVSDVSLNCQLAVFSFKKLEDNIVKHC